MDIRQSSKDLKHSRISHEFIVYFDKLHFESSFSSNSTKLSLLRVRVIYNIKLRGDNSSDHLLINELICLTFQL